MKHRLEIDALRGVAALAVLAAHADASDLVKWHFLTENKVFLGHFGVALFFILSGALIWQSAKDRPLGVYAINRATRILPLYLAAIAFAFVLPLVGSIFQPKLSADVVFRHLTFTQSFGDNVSRALNPVLWTLSYEAFFYMAVPLLMLGRRAAALLAIAALAIVAFGPLSVQFFGLFALGIFLVEFPTDRRLQTLGGIAAVFFFMAVQSEWRLAMVVALLVATFAVVPMPRTLRPLLVPVAWVGVVSYSLYIWHYLVLNIIAYWNDQLRELFGSWWAQDWFRAAFTLSIIAAVSVGSYVLIERPFMGPVRRWFTGATRVKVKKPATYQVVAQVKFDT